MSEYIEPDPCDPRGIDLLDGLLAKTKRPAIICSHGCRVPFDGRRDPQALLEAHDALVHLATSIAIGRHLTLVG